MPPLAFQQFGTRINWRHVFPTIDGHFVSFAAVSVSLRHVAHPPAEESRDGKYLGTSCRAIL